MAHVVDSYDMSLKYFLFPLDPWPLSEKVHFFFTAESRHTFYKLVFVSTYN